MGGGGGGSLGWLSLISQGRGEERRGEERRGEERRGEEGANKGRGEGACT